MSISVFIPTPLRPLLDGRELVQAEGKTVGEVLNSLVEQHPKLKRHLVEEDGRWRRFVNVYLNDEDIRFLEKEATPVAAGDSISLVPAIAGGEAVLTPPELQRYSRHLIIPEVGLAGQQRLKNSSVLCIGAGGLGSPVALYLAAAGVGRLGLVDDDVVDITNLQRQILHCTPFVGRPKVESARQRLEELNPEIVVETHPTRLTPENALELFSDYDLIVDGTDNFPTRYLVNDACLLSGKPNVYASVFRFEGQVTLLATLHGPCYRCLYAEAPPPGLVPSCAEGGVLGILPGLMGLLQATEALKWLLGIGRSLEGRLLLVDALGLSFRELKLKRDPDCPTCGTPPRITELADYEDFCGLTESDSSTNAIGELASVTAVELKRSLDSGDSITVLDVRHPGESAVCKIPGSILIPLDQLQSRLGELDTATPMVVHCKSGVRSARAILMLQQAGFKKLHNLEGGILDWIARVDPSQPTY